MSSTAYRLHKVGYDEIPGWRSDDLTDAFAAFRRSAVRGLEQHYCTGSLGITGNDQEPAFAKVAATGSAGPAAALEFFETCFQPVAIRPAAGKKGFVTGYYEPVADASPVRTARFRYPVYSVPDDLVNIGDNPVAGLPAGYRFARKTKAGLVPYFERRQIETGALSGRGLELAWLADKVDLFFIHVQGAARLRMPDGSELRITYAAKSGHPFCGPGSILAKTGEIARAEVTMQTIRAWFAENPDRIDEILWQNRSFIFFRQSRIADTGLGPEAAAKVALTPGRSLAVDRLIHTFGTPFFIDAPDLQTDTETGFRRLMIAQDTGSAITGPARGDLFFGTGAQAGAKAGVVKHDADFYVLVPNGAAERLLG